MLLLAMITGVPALVGEFLSEAEKSTLSPLEILNQLAKNPSSNNNAAECRKRLGEFLKTSSDTWQSVTCESVQNWRTRVSQFSFEDLSASGRQKETQVA